MTRLPAVRAAELIRALERIGFVRARQSGSHLRLRHPDGRAVTIPIHPGQDIGRGLLRKILRDAELNLDALMALL